MQSQIQIQQGFRKKPEKIPEKVMGLFSAKSGKVQQGSGEGSRKSWWKRFQKRFGEGYRNVWY